MRRAIKATDRSRARGARRGLAAFTLVELMVSVSVGALAITAIYAIGSTSTRQFQQQTQIASTQSALRFAMHQVKSDIARAGYMASARADNTVPFSNRICGGSIANNLSIVYTGGATGLLAGISAFENDIAGASSTPRGDTSAVSGGLAANVTAGFTADRLLLIGNYETSHEYPLTPIPPSTSQVAIPATSHSALTDFAWDDNGQPQAECSETVARGVFPTGSLIRIQMTDRQQHFALVSAVNVVAGQVLISFAPGVPTDCNAGGGTVAPLSVIRYAAREAQPATGITPLPATIDSARFSTPNSQGIIAQLMRVEMRPDQKDVVFAARPNVRHVLDYLAAFNLEFTLNGVTALNNPDNYVIGTRTNVAAGTGPTVVNPNVQRIRSVFVELAARMQSVDTTMPWSATGCANLRCYQVAGLDGQPLSTNYAARVRVLRGEVFVPNIAYEGY